jgi:hypothetical protein
MELLSKENEYRQRYVHVFNGFRFIFLFECLRNLIID